MSRTKGSNIRRQEEYFSHIELGITPTLLHRTPDGLFKNSDEFHQLRKSVVSILYKEDGEQVQDHIRHDLDFYNRKTPGYEHDITNVLERLKPGKWVTFYDERISREISVSYKRFHTDSELFNDAVSKKLIINSIKIYLNKNIIFEYVIEDDIINVTEQYRIQLKPSPHYTGGLIQEGSFLCSSYKDLLCFAFLESFDIHFKKKYNPKAHAQREGLWKAFHENGQLKEERNYKSGKQDGFYKVFHENGQLKEEGNYSDGKRDLFKLFHENGQLSLDASQSNLHKGFFKNGQVSDEVMYKDGIKDGFYRTFHKNGQIKEAGEYKNGHKKGVWKTFHENGQLKEEGNYNNFEYGFKTGLWKTFHKNGQIKEAGEYKNGRKTGVWQTLDNENGNKLCKTYYYLGQKRNRIVYLLIQMFISNANTK